MDVDYAALVRLIRTHRGLTQEDLARELDVTVGTLNGWENGRHRPLRAQRKRLERLAHDHDLQLPNSVPGERVAAARGTETKGKSDV